LSQEIIHDALTYFSRLIFKDQEPNSTSEEPL